MMLDAHGPEEIRAAFAAAIAASNASPSGRIVALGIVR